MITGVIEGFYGRAWNESQRATMLDWIVDAGMNTFIYAPKDDVHVRARWREPYGAEQLEALDRLRHNAEARNTGFMVAIAPCLDISYSDPQELERLLGRIDQLRGIGVNQFTLLFDDIPNQLPACDQPHFSSFAAAQCHVANAVMDHMRAHGGGTLLFCPTEYCARFADMDVPNSSYLNALGEALDKEIGVFWTGPEIVSAEISADSLVEVGRVLGRKPVIWDNFHANDYDIRRIYAGPLEGRESAILPLISGFITNPNNELEANFVPVLTTGRFLNDAQYDAEAALTAAIEAWRPAFRFAFRDPPAFMEAEEIRLLIELFYQPFACGPEISGLLNCAREMLEELRADTAAPAWQLGHERIQNLKVRIGTLFTHLTELENRELFHAFHPYLWEAQEEVIHLVTYLDWLSEKPGPETRFPHEQRIHNFYRRGFAVNVQELLKRDSNGRYFHED